MNLDVKYTRDYVPVVQKILFERYGVKFSKKDLYRIMVAPLKNITYGLLKKHSIVVDRRLHFFIEHEKMRKSRKPHKNLLSSAKD